MQVIRVRDYEEMSEKAAAYIASYVILEPQTVLGLATGSTPIGTYQRLIKRYKAGELDFSQVQAFNLDEYKGLDQNDPQSYHYFMRTNLFDSINIDPAHTHIPAGICEDADRACAEYDEAVAEAGYVDLQLLGIGNNGHIGFNEPADHFTEGTHCVDLTESTIEANSRLFERIEDVPRQAFSMGIGTIMTARDILILASGRAKAEAVRAMLHGPITPQCPASVLRLHPHCVVIADEEALELCD